MESRDNLFQQSISEKERQNIPKNLLIHFDTLHFLLASFEKKDREKISLQEVLKQAENLNTEMEEVHDRKGIHGGSMDGTSHAKFRSKDGTIWMAKDYPKERLHRAFVDEFVASLSHKLGLSTTMDVKIGTHNNVFKVFVRWEETNGSLWDDLREIGENREDFVRALTADELKQIATEQVLDWLVSNHDPHAGHFLRKKEGGFLCIDKAQAFKYLGDVDEHLSVDYNPNGSINGEDNVFYMPVYHFVLPEIAKGNGKISLKEIRQCIKSVVERVEGISDEEYQNALLPYAQFRFSVIQSHEDQKRGLNLERFMSLALQRKKDLRKSFERFYHDLEVMYSVS